MNLFRPLGLALTLVICSVPAAAQGSPWIHVEVHDGDDSKVHINVPLSLASVVVDVVPDHIVGEVTKEFEKEGMSVVKLRKLWTAFREVGDAEFVAIDSDDENVTISREGEALVIFVDEDEESVQIEIPVDVVDALLSGEEEALNLPAALDRLSDKRGDIVNVADGDETVRIWIDERS